MKVAILCGGRGTRLREVSETIPKPMVPIGEHPILWHVMKLYASHGLTEFVLLLGYKGTVIREYFLNFAAYECDVTVHLSATGDRRLTFHGPPAEPWQVTLLNTGEDTLTGGRVRRARRYLETDELFCLTYGDGVGNVDITALLAFHRQHGRLATVTAVRPPGRFGELVLDDHRHVRVFNEKPQVSGGYINGGFLSFTGMSWSGIFPTAMTSCSKRNLSKPWRGMANSWPSGTMASGNPWTHRASFNF